MYAENSYSSESLINHILSRQLEKCTIRHCNIMLTITVALPNNLGHQSGINQ